MKIRFIAKRRANGTWGVYDTDRAAWPALVSGFGRVEQLHDTEEKAASEAERLAGWFTTLR